MNGEEKKSPCNSLTCSISRGEQNLEAMVEQLQRERKRLKKALARIGRGRGGLSEAEKQGLDKKVDAFLADEETEGGGGGSDGDDDNDGEATLHVEDLVQAEHCFRELRSNCRSARGRFAKSAERERRLRNEVDRLKRELQSSAAAAEEKEGKEGRDAEYRPLLSGDIFIKYASNTTFGVVASAQPRFVWLSEDRSRICWRAVAATAAAPSHIEVADILEVREGRNTAAFERFPKGEEFGAVSFSVITERRTLDLEAADLDQFDGNAARQLCATWVGLIKRLV